MRRFIRKYVCGTFGHYWVKKLTGGVSNCWWCGRPFPRELVGLRKVKRGP